MKKWISLLLCITVVFMLTGCENNSSTSRPGNQPAGVKDVLEAGMAEENSKKEADNQTNTSESDDTASKRQNGVNENTPVLEEPSSTETITDSADGIDIDLTAISSTMVYSEVYNMMASPEEYLGKIVKMDGSFALYHDEATDKYYFACIISDATACCSQGIEFVLTDGYAYPDDYPEVGGKICVVGMFDTYQEGDYTYCTLRNARIV